MTINPVNEGDDATLKSLSTESATITDRDTVYAYGANGNYVEAFTVSDYANGGAAVQAALSALPTSGGVIQLPPGKLTVSDTISIPLDNHELVHIRGYGGRSESDPESADNVDYGSLLYSTITDSSKNVLEGITDGKADGVKLTDFTIIGSGSENNGVHLEISTDQTGLDDQGGIWSVGVERVGGHGFYLEGYGDNKVVNSGASECFGDGINLGPNSVNCVIDSCNVENNDGNGVTVLGNTTLIQCEVDASGKNGVRQFSGSDALTIIGGSISNNADWGINSDGRQQYYQNVVTNTNGSGGILVGGQNITIGRHTLNENSGAHIRLFGGPENVDIREGRRSGSGTDVLISDDSLNVNASIAGINSARGASPSGGSLTIPFDGAFSQKPDLNVVTEGEAIWHVSSWSTDAGGNYDGATLNFVDSGGTAVNPTTHWTATPVSY